jgi:hypothetical protein
VIASCYARPDSTRPTQPRHRRPRRSRTEIRSRRTLPGPRRLLAAQNLQTQTASRRTPRDDRQRITRAQTRGLDAWTKFDTSQSIGSPILRAFSKGPRVHFTQAFNPLNHPASLSPESREDVSYDQTLPLHRLLPRRTHAIPHRARSHRPQKQTPRRHMVLDLGASPRPLRPLPAGPQLHASPHVTRCHQFGCPISRF